MFEFFLDIECVGYFFDCLEIGVDVIWDGDVGFDVNYFYFYIVIIKLGDVLFECYVCFFDKMVV